MFEGKEIVEVRYCESISKIALLYKVDNKYKLHKTDVIDFDEAKEVARAYGFEGEVVKVGTDTVDRKKPLEAAA